MNPDRRGAANLKTEASLPYLTPKRFLLLSAIDRAWLRGLAGALGRRRRGRSEDRASWQDGYANGRHDRFGDLGELAHHSVLAGYLARLKPAGRVLDIGCGTGVTERMLRPWYQTYLGVDFAAAAIERAEAARDPARDTRFTVADANRFSTDERFDVILLCESIEYFEQPVAQLRRYASMLNEDGILLVSMWVSMRNLRLWPEIEAELPLLDETLVHNRNANAWMVKLFARPD